jgi:LmbE family N-acetylglucosaminyl deacetylase
MNKVLIVAAHPDDDILGCGGFISKYRSTMTFKVMFIAEGTTCRFSAEESCSDVALDQISTRNESALRALAKFGLHDVNFLGHPCGRLDQVPILDLNKAIEREIASFRPSTILTHYEHDTNNDHRIVYRSVSMATRPGASHLVPNLLCFETLSSTEWNFTEAFAPTHFESLDCTDIDAKWASLACYESEIREFPHPRSKLGVEILARYRGMQSGVAFAEAYKAVRIVKS